MSNKEIFISIIGPEYNAEEYLDECLQRILKQTINEDIELICVND
ncbi:glycosyltransferase, partial [Aliarcobacter butzleri]